MRSLFLLVCSIIAAVVVWAGFRAASKSPQPASSTVPVSATLESSSPTPLRNISSPIEITKSEPRTYQLSLIGTVTPDAQSALTVRIPSRIVQVLVKQGDRVRKGQLLVQFDSTEITAQIRTASAALEAARVQIRKASLGKSAQKLKFQTDRASAQSMVQQSKERLQQSTIALDSARDDAKSEIALARDTLRKAQEVHARALDSFQSLEKLSKVGGVSRSDLEAAQLQESTFRTDMNSARTQMKRLEAGPKKTPLVPYRVAMAEKDVESARQGVLHSEQAVRTADTALIQGIMLADQDILSAHALADQAKASYQGLITQLHQSQLISPINGLIAGVNAKAGETAQPGSSQVMVVGETGLHIEAIISARQLIHLRVNLPVGVRVDSMPNILYNAHISFISHTAEPDGRSFRIRIEFDKPVRIQPGVSATVILK